MSFYVANKEKGNWADSIFDDFFRSPLLSRANSNLMKTDIKETKEGYVLDIDLPGYDKNDVTIELEEGYLNISATKNTSKNEKDEDGKYVRRERYVGTCSRSFYVGDIKEETIKAEYNKGILTISIPKEEEKKINKKYIEIK